MAPAGPATDWLCEVLRQPRRLTGRTLADWDILVRQARSAGLLARLGCMLEAQAALDQVPTAPQTHLHAAMLRAEATHAHAIRALAWIDRALEPIGV